MKELEKLILSKSRPVQKEVKQLQKSELDRLIIEALLGEQEEKTFDFNNYDGYPASSKSENAEYYLVWGLTNLGADLNKWTFIAKDKDPYVRGSIKVGQKLAEKLAGRLGELTPENTYVAGSAAYETRAGDKSTSVTDIIIGGKRVTVKNAKGSQGTVWEPARLTSIMRGAFAAIDPTFNSAQLISYMVDTTEKYTKAFPSGKDFAAYFKKYKYDPKGIVFYTDEEGNTEAALRGSEKADNILDNPREEAYFAPAFILGDKVKLISSPYVVKETGDDNDGKIEGVDGKTYYLHRSTPPPTSERSDLNNAINGLLNWQNISDKGKNKAVQQFIAASPTTTDAKQYVEKVREIVSNPKFQEALAREAITGLQKFPKGSAAIPEYMLYFDENKPQDGFKLVALTDEYFKNLVEKGILTFGSSAGKGTEKVFKPNKEEKYTSELDFKPKRYKSEEEGLTFRKGGIRPRSKSVEADGSIELLPADLVQNDERDGPIVEREEKEMTPDQLKGEIEKYINDNKEAIEKEVAKQSAEGAMKKLSDLTLTANVNFDKIKLDNTVEI